LSNPLAKTVKLAACTASATEKVNSVAAVAATAIFSSMINLLIIIDTQGERSLFSA
jgi:hypothetical protein